MIIGEDYMLKKIRNLLAKQHWYIAYPAITLGCVVYALGFSVFLTPNRISPGGLSGIAVIINYLVPVASTGMLILILNIPLMVLGLVKLGGRFVIRTVYAVVVSSLLIDMAERLITPYCKNVLLAAVAGGVLMGMGIAIIMSYGATTGGTDIAVKIINKKYHHLPYGTIFLALDTVVVLLATVAYRDLETALFSIVAIFASSAIINKLCYGNDGGKLVYVVTRNHRLLADEIMRVSDRGVTLLDAVGGYTGDELKVIMCAVRRYEISTVTETVKRLDPDAFVIITDSNEISGFGFTR